MKKFLLSALALMAALSVSAQNGQTVLEWSLSDSRNGGDKPKWSLAAIGSLEGGFAHRFDAPDYTNPSGFFAEVSFLELRYRPWQNGNLFTLSLDYYGETYTVDRNYSVNASGQFVSVPSDVRHKSTNSECIFHANLGFTAEFGKLSAGVFVCPGLGYGNAHNSFDVGGTSLSVQEDIRTKASFRLGVKAGFWYDYFGIVFGYHFGNVVRIQDLPSCSSAFVGLSIRY